MSIYATLWTLKFPRDGDATLGCDWVTVHAQAVPAHIGTPTPGHGYEGGDPFAGFLPPPVSVDAEGEASYPRAVVFVTEDTIKGTARHPQEFAGPLLVLPGDVYARMTFKDLHQRLCDVLRGNRAPVVAEILSPDGSHKVIRHREAKRREAQGKVPPPDLDLGRPFELAVLSVKERAARCRLLNSDHTITLRASGLWHIVPGAIVVVGPDKQWHYAGHAYLSGKIESEHLDVKKLGLAPLQLQDRGIWRPEDHYWGEDDEPIADWAKPIVDRGPRPSFEMEQVVPGMDWNDFDSDPITDRTT